MVPNHLIIAIDYFVINKIKIIPINFIYFLYNLRNYFEKCYVVTFLLFKK